ncbi:MAG TPA: hypothetical protein VK666_28420 [Chryseolinea sp.]|nr:hypothetical protein [Chryseolinea sp.]
MRKKFFLLLTAFLLTTAFTFSQTIEVLKTSGAKDLPAAQDFAFIEKKTDSAGYKFISTYKLTGTKKKANITYLFLQVAERAKTDGANCFKLNSFHRNDSLKEATLILDTYNWNDSMRNVNFSNHEQNCIYLLGGEDPNDDNDISFKIDNEKKVLKSGTYYKHVRTNGKEVKISKGGLAGTTLWYTLVGNKPDLFLTMTGLGLGGGPVPTNVVGLSFNTGRIQPVQGDLGCLLIAILKQGE